MDLVEDLADPIVPIATACQALGVSRATLYRCTRPTSPRSLFVQRALSPRRASDAERATILDTFHSAEFGDQSVIEVYATLLSRGVSRPPLNGSIVRRTAVSSKLSRDSE